MYNFRLAGHFLNVDLPMAGTVKFCNLPHPTEFHLYSSKIFFREYKYGYYSTADIER